tara:strand:- start:115 stop:402 length:288 start_codon:yes stop_codon:yes gene_type:complete
MAQTKNGNRAGYAYNQIETLSGAVTLVPGDSGKVFLCAAATVTLPSASDAGAGWHAKFVYKSGTTTVDGLAQPDAAGEFVDVFCDGSAYYKVGEY